MSLKQRRDHRVKPLVSPLRETADEYRAPTCRVCGDRITLVNTYYENQHGHVIENHWRHWRRP